MPLQLCHGIIVIRFQRQVAALGIPLEEPSLLQESGYTVTDGMHQRFEFIEAWRFERVSSDNDPLFQYHRWKANLRVLEIEEVKSLPHAPMSHPFVERLIGSVRRELLDQTFFWTATDLENKLQDYQMYYNEHRCHSSR